MPVYKLQRTATVYKKNNTYTLYVTKEKPYRPVRYVMHGYDTLLHSFYDHYVVDYLSFHKWDFDFNIMKIPKGEYDTQRMTHLLAGLLPMTSYSSILTFYSLLSVCIFSLYTSEGAEEEDLFNNQKLPRSAVISFFLMT